MLINEEYFELNESGILVLPILSFDGILHGHRIMSLEHWIDTNESHGLILDKLGDKYRIQEV